MTLPDARRQLLLYSDGFNLFGEPLYDTRQLQYHTEPGLIVFHDWGNGDFDGIAANSPHYPDGTIAFINHSPDVHCRVADNLEAWVEAVIGEIARQGALRHPGDYRGHRSSDGLYRPVYDALRVRDCELNGWRHYHNT